MIKEDSISVGLTFMGFGILMYLLVLEVTPQLIIPTILLLGGVGFSLWQRRMKKQDPVEDTQTDERERSKILKYTMYSLAVMVGGYFISQRLFSPPPALVLSSFDRVLYGQLYAVAEERFFRVMWSEFFWYRLKMQVAAVAGSTGMFTLYHLNVYGSSGPGLTYVLFAGATLGWFAWKAGRYSPAFLGHSLNNLGLSVVALTSGGA